MGRTTGAAYLESRNHEIPVHHSFCCCRDGQHRRHGAKPTPPEKAFKVEAKQVSPTEVDFVYQIAPGYVLYRDRFAMVMSGGSTQVSAVAIPAGEKKFDKALNQEMEMYRDRVTVKVTLKPGQGSPGTLVATAQGCAFAQGVCYPPFNKAWSLGPVNVDTLMSNHAADCAAKDMHFSSKFAHSNAC